MNKYYRKFKKNSKALSPVIASIILIAVTVAVSVVVAAWMGGMTIGLMGNTEQVSITNVQFSPGTGASGADQLIVLVQNSGGNDITISTNGYVNGASVTVASTKVVKSSSEPVTLTLATPLASGQSYAVKLITVKGTQISATQTYSP